MCSMMNMIFLFNFYTLLIITIVSPASIWGQETQAQTLNSPNLDSGISNVHIAVGNSECRARNSVKVSYLLGTQKVTWFQAYVLCKQSGMELASVSSIDEENALENYTSTFEHKVGPYEGYWLAGTRHGACASDFVWLTSGKPVIYRKFSAGQPDNAGGVEACLQIFLNGPNIFAWNDIPCDQKLGFICQTSNCYY